MPQILVPSEEEDVDFCLSKCGDGYCDYRKRKGGFPCIEYICNFCAATTCMLPAEKRNYCKFCKGEI